jgi:excisionase family DNA binding protein
MLKLRARAKPVHREDAKLLGSNSLVPSEPSDDASLSTTIRPATAPPFLSLREAAEWLCVSISTLKRMIAKGELIAVHVGKRRKVPASVLTAYITKDVLFPSQVIDNTDPT